MRRVGSGEEAGGSDGEQAASSTVAASTEPAVSLIMEPL
jgi:hypothetical protein